MDLKTALNQYTIDKDHVYQQWIQWATEENDKLLEVLDFAFNGSEKERKRANWILHHVGDRRPEVFYAKENVMINQLAQTETAAEVRFILRYYSKYRMPRHEEREGVLVDYCFETLMTPSEAVAPRVYAMTIIHRMVSRYPELAHELEQSIVIALEHGSAGMKNRGQKILKDLRKKGLI